MVEKPAARRFSSTRVVWGALFCFILLFPAQVFPQETNTSESVIDLLNRTISWYRLVESQQQLATEPSDVLFLNDSRQNALQVLRLGFEFARADAALITADDRNQPAERNVPGGQSARLQNLTRLAARAGESLKRAQSELETLERRLPAARGQQLVILRSQIANARSALQLAQARSETLNSFVEFLSGPGTGAAGGLLGQIDELARSVPEMQADTAQAARTPASTTLAPGIARREPPAGVVALTTDLFSLTRKLRKQRDLMNATDALRETVRNLRRPLMNQLREAARQGDQLAQLPVTANPEELGARTQQIDALTTRFKQVSSAAVPLGKMRILLDASHANSAQWMSDTERVYTEELRALGFRLIALLVCVGLIFAGSEAWKRATFRYVREIRRRNQFMLLRRIVVTVVVIAVVTFGLVTEVGSLATFAGFITAGLAIALQNVILSVVAYFFLIGKYGIRVGDRVQIAGVTGNVIDVGLVRLHLMEVDSTGAEEQPTGRVVVFSNSIVFQPAANFFKQAPGTNFGWRRVSLTLAPETDYRVAEKRLMEAVDGVFATYREDMERQYESMQKTLSIPINPPQPQSRMKLSNSGLEVVIRYPAPLDRLSYVDDQVTRSLVQAITTEPMLKLAGSGMPTIQPVSDLPQSPAPGVAVDRRKKQE